MDRISRRAMHSRLRNRRGVEQLEPRLLLAADTHMMNPMDCMDVNDDGLVTPRDVLSVMNRLQHPKSPNDAKYPDVNGDGNITPSDILTVLNHLNLHGGRYAHGPPPAMEAYAIDGTGNHLEHSEWGSTNEALLRHVDAAYTDGMETPAGNDRPSARAVSNMMSDQKTDVPNERHLTDMTWLWGQFIDHDISLTESQSPGDPFPIPVPEGDPHFDPASSGEKQIMLFRSVFLEDTGGENGTPRLQFNQITAFLDGSMVYGSDAGRAAALRTFEGGRMAVSEGKLLPFNTQGFHNAGGDHEELFLAGDIRANENALLSAMHTLWVREHNRLADAISADRPELSDEVVFQRARSIVIGQLQAITYNEFLPALLGPDAIGEYSGYHPSTNPGISNLFSTAAYRFGHSMLTSELQRVDADGNPDSAGSLPLRSAFFAPDQVTQHGIDSLLMGATKQRANEIDTQVVDDVRNFLFGPPGSGGFDLAALNIQRGRDHGLADYNQVRAELGLERATSFADITSDAELQAKLQELYGDVEHIDVWVGALAEDHVAGASVGELAYTVLVDQFRRLRDGDRLWYQNQFSGRDLARIENTTLADVMVRNTSIPEMHDHVFFMDGADS